MLATPNVSQSLIHVILNTRPCSSIACMREKCNVFVAGLQRLYDDKAEEKPTGLGKEQSNYEEKSDNKAH